MFLISMIVSISLLQFCFTRILNLELVADVAECKPSSCADGKSSDTRLLLQTVKHKKIRFVNILCKRQNQQIVEIDCRQLTALVHGSTFYFWSTLLLEPKFPIFIGKIVWRWTAYSSGCQSSKVSLLGCSCLIQHFSIRLKEPIFFRFKIVWHILWKILNLILLQRNSSNRNYFELIFSRKEFENRDAEAIF